MSSMVVAAAAVMPSDELSNRAARESTERCMLVCVCV